MRDEIWGGKRGGRDDFPLAHARVASLFPAGFF